MLPEPLNSFADRIVRNHEVIPFVRALLNQYKISDGVFELLMRERSGTLNAHGEGQLAWMEGKRIEDNPYLPTSIRRDPWDDGYVFARDGGR